MSRGLSEQTAEIKFVIGCEPLPIDNAVELNQLSSCNGRTPYDNLKGPDEVPFLFWL